MSRTRLYPLVYALAAAGLTALVVLSYMAAGMTGFFVCGLLLLVPGRLGAYFLRDLFLSRILVDRKQYREAIAAGTAFLAALERQPWRRYLVYCHYNAYTWDPEAMARNNIAAAHLELGELDEAEKELRRALRKDADYAIPYFNLAVIAYVRGDAAEGDRLIALAAQKGYTAGRIDQLITRISAAYARVQARV